MNNKFVVLVLALFCAIVFSGSVSAVQLGACEETGAQLTCADINDSFLCAAFTDDDCNWNVSSCENVTDTDMYCDDIFMESPCGLNTTGACAWNASAQSTFLNLSVYYPYPGAILNQSNFTFITSVGIPSNCSLYLNDSGWSVFNTTTNLTGQWDTKANLTDGDYEWNMYCVDYSDADNDDWADWGANFTFTINTSGAGFVPECTEHAECDVGEICNTGTCESVVCTADSDCNGWFCGDSVCSATSGGVPAEMSSEYCMLDNFNPMDSGETTDEINITYIIEVNVPNWTDAGCDNEFNSEWDRPGLNMNTKWEMWMPPEECMMSGPEDFMDGDGKWLYSDSEGCFDIFEESECMTYTTTESGLEYACEWFDEYMFTGCEPAEPYCEMLTDSSACGEIPYCSWDSDSSLCLENETMIFGDDFMMDGPDMMDDMCSPPSKYSCWAWKQAEFKDNSNTTYVFNLYNLSDDKYTVSIEAPYSCRKVLGSITYDLNLSGSTTVYNLSYPEATKANGSIFLDDDTTAFSGYVNAWSNNGAGWAWAEILPDHCENSEDAQQWSPNCWNLDVNVTCNDTFGCEWNSTEGSCWSIKDEPYASDSKYDYESSNTAYKWMNETECGLTINGTWIENDGTFELYGLNKGEYQIEFYNWDNTGADTRYQTTITLSDGTEQNLGRFVFGSGPGVEGHINNSVGDPVAYQWINIETKVDWNDYDAWMTMKWYGGQSDINGDFSISGIEPGEYRITVWPDWDSDYIPYEAEITITNDSKIIHNITLTTGTVIKGYITNDTGDNLSGVSVSAFVPWDMSMDNMGGDCEYCGPGYNSWAQTDSNGYYELKGLKPAKYMVEVWPDTWANTELDGYVSDRANVLLNASDETVNFILSKGMTLNGTIYNATGDGAVACGWINAWVPSSDKFMGPSAWAWAEIENDGSYEMTGLVTGKVYQAYVEPCWDTGLTGKNFEINMTTDQTKNINLTSGGKIIGKVVDATGTGVKGASVSVWLEYGMGWGYAMTSSDGTFKIKGLSPSTSSSKYHVEVWSGQYTPYGINDVVVLEGAETDIGTVVMNNGYTLNGTVLRDASPIVDAYVDVWCEGGYGWGSAKTGSDGVYTISGLSACNYSMYIYLPDTYENKFIPNIEVSTDGGVHNVNFITESSLVNISGYVLNSSDSSAVEGAMVSVFSPGNYSGGTATTDADGAYIITKLLPSSDYEVIVEQNLYYVNFTENVNLEITSEYNVTLDTIDVSVGSVFNITGTVIGATGDVIVLAVNVNDSLITEYVMTNYTYTIENLPNGHYTVSAIKGITVQDYPLTVSDVGINTGIDFDFS